MRNVLFLIFLVTRTEPGMICYIFQGWVTRRRCLHRIQTNNNFRMSTLLHLMCYYAAYAHFCIVIGTLRILASHCYVNYFHFFCG